MKFILELVDKFLCDYLGLRKAEIIPHHVGKKDTQILIQNTESHKRHIHETPLSKINIDLISKDNRNKLGVALGKTIARNLIVSFDEVVIKRENHHAR
jgi:hypothetical protein